MQYSLHFHTHIVTLITPTSRPSPSSMHASVSVKVPTWSSPVHVRSTVPSLAVPVSSSARNRINLINLVIHIAALDAHRCRKWSHIPTNQSIHRKLAHDRIDISSASSLLPCENNHFPPQSYLNAGFGPTVFAVIGLIASDVSMSRVLVLVVFVMWLW